MADEMGDRSDEALLAAAACDSAAFGEIYRRHAEALLTYFLRRTGSTETALDLTGEVFAAALQGLRRFDAKRGPVRAWLFGIANRKLAARGRRWSVDDRARRRLGMQRIRFTDDELERVEERIDAERRDPSVESLVADLPAGEREAVLARVVDEREYPEIAAGLGCSEGAVRTRVSRGLARLALSIKEQKQ
ncbi:MAG: RNA polymerase sigma factor [Thermoleophilaceae bacterium]